MRTANHHARFVLPLMLVALAALAATANAFAANSDDKAGEKVDWQRWAQHAADGNGMPVDYSQWTVFTDQFSDDDGAIDYLWVQNRGVQAMNKLVYQLQKVPVSKLTRDQQLAFWLNLHNIEAIRQTSFAYPFKDDSTRNLMLADRKPWKDKTVHVEGVDLSLEDIEKRVLFKQWPDPRVLYGLYLPTITGPQLNHEPIQGKNIWKTLEARGRQYVNSRRAWEIRDGDLHVSALYLWAPSLFGDDNDKILAQLRKYADPEVRAKLAEYEDITALYFNWRLNTFNSGYDINQDRGGGMGS